MARHRFGSETTVNQWELRPEVFSSDSSEEEIVSNDSDLWTPPVAGDSEEDSSSVGSNFPIDDQEVMITEGPIPAIPISAVPLNITDSSGSSQVRVQSNAPDPSRPEVTLVEMYLGGLIVRMVPGRNLSREQLESSVALARQLYELRQTLFENIDQDYSVYQEFITRVKAIYQAWDSNVLTMGLWLEIMNDVLPKTPTWRSELDQYFDRESYCTISDWIYLVEEYIRMKFKKN